MNSLVDKENQDSRKRVPGFKGGLSKSSLSSTKITSRTPLKGLTLSEAQSAEHTQPTQTAKSTDNGLSKSGSSSFVSKGQENTLNLRKRRMQKMFGLKSFGNLGSARRVTNVASNNTDDEDDDEEETETTNHPMVENKKPRVDTGNVATKNTSNVSLSSSFFANELSESFAGGNKDKNAPNSNTKNAVLKTVDMSVDDSVNKSNLLFKTPHQRSSSSAERSVGKESNHDEESSAHKRSFSSISTTRSHGKLNDTSLNTSNINASSMALRKKLDLDLSVTKTPAPLPKTSTNGNGSAAKMKKLSPTLQALESTTSKQTPVTTPASHATGLAERAPRRTHGLSERKPDPHVEPVNAVMKQKNVAAVSQPQQRNSAKKVTSLARDMPPPAPVTKAKIAAAPIASVPPVAKAIPATKKSSSSGANHVFIVNKKSYLTLSLIGSGGSSKVYKVFSKDKQIYALKRITLSREEKGHVANYRNEIQLLRRLRGKAHVIQLVDYEECLDQGVIFMLFELGEIDLSQLMKRARVNNEILSCTEIQHYWHQILKCVKVCHEEKVIHLDLKPPNFVFVRAELKIIDFGIAKAAESTNTTSIIRDKQVGTLNYMSPESIMDMDGSAGQFKLGRSTDIWSLGCILYQMVYGRAPFSHITQVFQKLHSITNPNYEIDFTPPANREVNPQLMDCLQKMLARDPKKRPSIDALLAHPYLHPAHQPMSPVFTDEQLQLMWTQMSKLQGHQEGMKVLTPEMAATLRMSLASK